MLRAFLCIYTKCSKYLRICQSNRVSLKVTLVLLFQLNFHPYTQGNRFDSVPSSAVMIIGLMQKPSSTKELLVEGVV